MCLNLLNAFRIHKILSHKVYISQIPIVVVWCIFGWSCLWKVGEHCSKSHLVQECGVFLLDSNQSILSGNVSLGKLEVIQFCMNHFLDSCALNFIYPQIIFVCLALQAVLVTR